GKPSGRARLKRLADGRPEPAHAGRCLPLQGRLGGRPGLFRSQVEEPGHGGRHDRRHGDHRRPAPLRRPPAMGHHESRLRRPEPEEPAGTDHAVGQPDRYARSGSNGMTRWFEDIVIDEVFALGSHTFAQDEIITFATIYDPQYFHLDPEQAKHSHFGGLVASGWHTVSVGHRKMVDALFAEEERLRAEGNEPGVSGPSPGVNSMVFKVPVRPGDTVSYELVVTGKRASNSIPGWGLLFNRL